MRQCSNCLIPLKGKQTRFCSEQCGREFHNNQVKYAKQRKRKEAEVRYCKYEKCGKELPKGINPLKMYCPSTDCSYRQNQIEQKRRREDDKKNKQPVIRICNHKPCSKEFQVEGHKTRQSYCSKECRTKEEKIRVNTHQAENTKIVQKAKDNRETIRHINPKYLVRGNITHGDRGCNISFEA